MQIEPVTLEGSYVRLVPLSADDHPRLCEIGLDPALWECTTIRVRTEAEMLDYVRAALAQRDAADALPFTIRLRETDTIVGTTRFHSISSQHRRAEIGYTFVAIPWQRTAVNTESKYLLLRHAFEQWHCQRVEFKADADNHRSRDAAVYSILGAEWPDVKARLERKLSGRART